ncbi:MAG: metal-sensitive transcriptional regulator [Bacteroidota bacterium]
MADVTPADFQTEVREEILARLRRAEGQLRGIQKMIADGRACQEVLIQLAAVKAAVVQAAMTILSTQLAHCVQEEGPAGKGDREALARFMEVFKKFS